MKKDNKTICFNDPLGNPYLILNLPEKEIRKIQNKLKGGQKMTVDEVPGYKDKKALAELYVKKGMSAGQIAKMFKVSRTVILYWLKRNGIEITMSGSFSSKTSIIGAHSTRPLILKEPLPSTLFCHSIIHSPNTSTTCKTFPRIRREDSLTCCHFTCPKAIMAGHLTWRLTAGYYRAYPSTPKGFWSTRFNS